MPKRICPALFEVKSETDSLMSGPSTGTFMRLHSCNSLVMPLMSLLLLESTAAMNSDG